MTFAGQSLYRRRPSHYVSSARPDETWYEARAIYLFNTLFWIFLKCSLYSYIVFKYFYSNTLQYGRVSSA